MRLLHLIVLWLLLGIVSAPAALEVHSPRWGFGGKPVLGTFNILSVEVRNTGQALVNDVLKLSAENDGYSSAPCQLPVTLSPGQSRWVQFEVYLGNYKPNYTITWGEHDEFPVENPQGEKPHGPPAIVVLADPEMVRTTHLPVFPEEMFPVSASATDGLHAVLLDHAPKFRGVPQAEAFLDWVQLGGIVILLPGPGGALPTFEGKLAPLNIEGDKGRVGAGWVVKEPFTVAEVTLAQLESAGFPAPTEPAGNGYNSYTGYRGDDPTSTDSVFFETLAMVTRPHLPWWLIYLLTGVYVIIIGPVFFILRKRDYRVLLLGFLGTVVLFAWLFTIIGKRGYGERQVCHSLAVARVLGGGRYDVTHWSHAFATSGNTYRFSYPGTSQLYGAIGQAGEKVRGTIQLGGDAYFEADIPLFSFRNFIHRGVMTGQDVAATLVSVPKSDPSFNRHQWRDSFRATLAAEVPGEVISAAVQVGTYYLSAKIDGREVRITDYNPNSGIDILSPSDYSGRMNRSGRVSRFGGESSEDALDDLRNDGPALAQRAHGETDNKTRTIGRAPGKETLRLYIYAAAPKAFPLTDKDFATDKNFVLYVQDLAIPSGLSPSP